MVKAVLPATARSYFARIMITNEKTQRVPAHMDSLSAGVKTAANCTFSQEAGNNNDNFACFGEKRQGKFIHNGRRLPLKYADPDG